MYKLKFLGIIFLLILFVGCKENSSATKDKNTSHIKTENANTGQSEISVKNNSNTGSLKDLIKERNQVNAKISKFQSENTRKKSLRIKEIRKEIKALNQSSGINDLLSREK